MGDPRQLLGIAAERAVALWLERCGWEIVGQRARSETGGEVDLVARDPDGVLVAVEVRARRSRRTGAAVETVDERKVRRVQRTLASVAAGSPRRMSALRVDLVTAEPDGTTGRWRLVRHPGLG